MQKVCGPPPKYIGYFHTDSKFFVLQFRPFRPEWRGDAEAYLIIQKLRGGRMRLIQGFPREITPGNFQDVIFILAFLHSNNKYFGFY